MYNLSIVSCVNDFKKYDQCVRSSFRNSGVSQTVELLPIDNSGNRYSIPQALNAGIEKASADIIICCHQDVIFPEKWTDALLEQITIVEQREKNWGVLGTFGVTFNGMFAGHIIDPSGHSHCLPLPAKVQSLDEHCLIIKKDSDLAFDENIGGFHLYGADICLEAMAKGLTNFAIDACVQHLSPGKADDNFTEAVDKLYQKWRNKKSPLAVIETTCKMCRLQGGLKGMIAYRIVRYKRKQKRKKVKEMLKKGTDFTKLRHDSI